MADTLNVITIAGSLRKGSYNAALARALPALAPAGLSIKPAPSFEAFPIYNADDQNSSGFPAPVNTLADAIRAADALIIVSPEYNYSIPGGLKNAIDWVSRLQNQPFAGKPIALQSATGGPLGGARVQYHLRQTMVFLDGLVFTRPEVFVGLAQQKFDEKTLELKDQPTIDIIKQQLAGFEKFIRRVSGR
jgi:chromate reductase, NAD(P)H dehydrogenase (quinone)